ncbi:hypothetical protein QBC44DRAFT_312533 [Cladorrhinum sp. PSN332]|nr:hypothetical protein QBC44DRAFT_312533 [Cladorrhinum sp. PSN332]
METTGHIDDDEVIFISSNLNDCAAADNDPDAPKPSNSDLNLPGGSSVALSRMSSNAQRKRSYSDAGIGSVKSPVDCPKFMVLHLNVLCDGRAGLIHTMTAIFKDVLPQLKPPPAIDIISAFAAAPILETVFRILTNGRITSRETTMCTQAYMRIFNRDALPMMSLYDDVKPFLRAARANGVTTMLQTDLLHKAEALINDPEVLGLLDLFVDTKTAYLNTHAGGPGSLIPLGNTNIMKAYARHYIQKKMNGEVVDENDMPDPRKLVPPNQVLVLSCTPYGLKSAKMVGARACWVKKCEVIPPHDVRIDHVVESLDELAKEIFKKRQKVEAEPEVKEGPVLESIEMGEDLPDIRGNFEEPEVEDDDLSDEGFGPVETLGQPTQLGQSLGF